MRSAGQDCESRLRELARKVIGQEHNDVGHNEVRGNCGSSDVVKHVVATALVVDPDTSSALTPPSPPSMS